MIQHNTFKSLQFLAPCKRCSDLHHANTCHHTERIDFTCTRLAEIRWTKNTDVLVDMFARFHCRRSTLCSPWDDCGLHSCFMYGCLVGWLGVCLFVCVLRMRVSWTFCLIGAPSSNLTYWFKAWVCPVTYQPYI